MSYEDYSEGFKDGQRSYKVERARRANYNANATEALDKLIRYFDRAHPALAEELRAVCKDYHHPSLVWKMEAKSG